MLKKITLGLLLLFLTNISSGQNFWERIQSPTDNFLRTLHFSDSLTGWVGGDSGSIFFTSDGGLNWIQQQTNTNSKIMRLFFLDDYRAWALAWADAGSGDNSFYGTEILKTTDGGENWSIEQYRDENIFLRGIYFLDTLKGFAGGVPGQFLKTTDGGLNWEPANIDSGIFSHFPVIDFKFFNQLYGFACGGRFDIAGVIWRTTNGGESWAPLDAQYSPADEVWDIHFFDSLHVMAIGGDPDLFGVGIMHSTDAGISWSYEEIGVFGQALALSFRTENEGWAVVPQSETFVATFDYGVNWLSYPTPDSSKLYDIQFTDSLIGYAVGEEGVIAKYRYQPPDFVSEEFSTIVKDFILYQNFPNPFNPATTISFNLSEPGQVSLNIYNVLGTRITTLLEDYKSNGNHSVVWNAENEPSGVYYFQLNVYGKLETRKMMLLK
ncbi:MAG: T9SS type A sorting domain-containing protein [Ignavibacteriaceae bacterium]|nr:T9SS type A sorting domain-containing protein [Ignavibacteriaceae bacterium]